MNDPSIKKIIVILVIILVVVLIVCMVNRQKTTKSISPSSQSSDSDSKVKVETAVEQPLAPLVQNNIPRLDAPVLRCYDYFEFPNEGSFHVKTCSAPNSSDDKKTSKSTRIFIQWFPVAGASEYVIYANKGGVVSAESYMKKWPVTASNHYFESEPLDGNGCWSVIVSAIDSSNTEGTPSVIYSTCN